MFNFAIVHVTNYIPYVVGFCSMFKKFFTTTKILRNMVEEEDPKLAYLQLRNTGITISKPENEPKTGTRDHRRPK